MIDEYRRQGCSNHGQAWIWLYEGRRCWEWEVTRKIAKGIGVAYRLRPWERDSSVLHQYLLVFFPHTCLYIFFYFYYSNRSSAPSFSYWYIIIISKCHFFPSDFVYSTTEIGLCVFQNCISSLFGSFSLAITIIVENWDLSLTFSDSVKLIKLASISILITCHLGLMNCISKLLFTW